MTVSVTKKASKQRGLFSISSVGYHENDGNPYYEVASTEPEKRGPYRVYVVDGHADRCTCRDFVKYRVFLFDKERCCKHMTGIDHLLELQRQEKEAQHEATQRA